MDKNQEEFQHPKETNKNLDSIFITSARPEVKLLKVTC